MRRAATSPLLGLAPRGGYRAAHIAARAGALLPHLFTLTRRHSNRGQSPSLWPSSLGHPNRMLSGTLPSGARTFLRRSSRARDRPAGPRVNPNLIGIHPVWQGFPQFKPPHPSSPTPPQPPPAARFPAQIGIPSPKADTWCAPRPLHPPLRRAPLHASPPHSPPRFPSPPA